jgi:hypothetical protein
MTNDELIKEARYYIEDDVWKDSPVSKLLARMVDALKSASRGVDVDVVIAQLKAAKLTSAAKALEGK